MTEMDDPVLAKILESVRLEVVRPMRIQIEKHLGNKLTDVHVFDVGIGASLADVQKQVTGIVARWKGGFPIGARYVVERLPSEDQ